MMVTGILPHLHLAVKKVFDIRFLPHLETNPNQDSLYPFGSSWRKGMLRRKTTKIMMKILIVLK